MFRPVIGHNEGNHSYHVSENNAGFTRGYMFVKTVKIAATFHVIISFIVTEYGPKYDGNVAANKYSKPLVYRNGV